MEDYRKQIEILHATLRPWITKFDRELFDEGEGSTNGMQILKEGGRIRRKSSK